MGFKKPNLDQAYQAISNSLREINSPYNDGFTSSHCKHELYMLKCWLEDEYRKLPTYIGEDSWVRQREQEKIVQILRQ